MHMLIMLQIDKKGKIGEECKGMDGERWGQEEAEEINRTVHDS